MGDTIGKAMGMGARTSNFATSVETEAVVINGLVGWCRVVVDVVGSQSKTSIAVVDHVRHVSICADSLPK